jgi:hypothetical protein
MRVFGIFADDDPTVSVSGRGDGGISGLVPVRTDATCTASCPLLKRGRDSRPRSATSLVFPFVNGGDIPRSRHRVTSRVVT